MKTERAQQIQSITARLEMAADREIGESNNEWYRLMNRISSSIDIYLIEQELKL
jgi:hypothetical protein